MAISSRLALWEQKIKEEDRTPTPSSPPPLFSVIPGGFIKQLVRETEKESQEAKRKEKVALNAKENPPGKEVDGPVQPFVIKDPNILEVGMASKGQGQLLQGRLNGEKPGGEALPEIPERKLPPCKRATARSSAKPPVSLAPEPAPPAAPKCGEAVPSAGSQPPKAPSPEQSERSHVKDAGTGPEPARKGHAPWHKRFESPGKENVDVGAKEELPSRLAGKTRGAGKAREPGESKEKSAEVGKQAGDARKRLGEKIKERTGRPGKESADATGHTGEIRKGLAEVKEKAGKSGKGMGGVQKKVGEVGKGPGGTEEDVGEKVLAETQEEEGGISGKGPQGPKEDPAPTAGEREPDSAAAAGGKGDGEPEENRHRGPAGESLEEWSERASPDKACEDTWYETEKVWLVQKEDFTLATQLKPDVGTPELPAGKVRVRVEADGSILEVEEEAIQRTNPSRLDFAEDLASLVSLNESSAVHTLRQRFQAQLVYTYSGSDLIAIEPPPCATKGSKKVQAFKGKRDGMSPHIFSVAQRAYWSMLTQRQDQALVPLGRSCAGKTTCCQNALEYLVAMAGGADDRVTVEKIQAMFVVLRAFGSITTAQNEASTRFSMVMALDFSASGFITAAHLQTMLLERVRVAQQPEGESNFNIFAQMLAGLGLDQRTLLHLHQMAESHSFGIGPFSKPEEKQKASAAFSQLRAAMGTLGITAGEEEAIWHVLAGIYHLGAAGACKVGRKQFMKFEWASHAAEALGCDVEELSTAVFKHHLQRILEQATSGPGGQPGQVEDPPDGPKLTATECVEGMAAGLYEELFATVVSLINRSFSSSLLSVASISVVDTPGFHNPRHQRKERAATFEEFCHNYAQERLQGLFYERTFVAALERYREENVKVPFDLPELSPAHVVALIDQNTSKVLVSPGSQGEEPKGLLWILDEEALIQGSGDSVALNRLCAHFVKEGTNVEERAALRKCEQALQFEIAHQLGKDPVRYDATGWVNKAKWNLSVQNAVQVLHQSRVDALRSLFLPRSKMPLICRSVAGLEGSSEQALQRIGHVRRAFTSGLAAARKRSVCAQIKLQLDALLHLVQRSQLHFVHCLVPRMQVGRAEEPHLQPGLSPAATAGPSWDIPALRAQLSGGLILEALRLYRIGYADRMMLTQFRRRFQILAQPVMKKYTSAYETTDEDKALEELFQALNLEKKSIAVGHTQIFLKAGILSSLEKQREKLMSQNLVSLQAACKGFLSRQRYRRLKIQRLAARCIQRNLVVFQGVRTWPWWQLLCAIRPLLTVSVAEGQLRAKEEEIMMLRKKLENSELCRKELRQSTELLETKVLDLTMELSDERLKGDVACQVLEGERAERLRGGKEIKELKNKHDQLQKKLESVEKQLEETQQQLQFREIRANTASGKGEEWQMHLECAQTEIGFLRKRITQLEERLQSEQAAKKELEGKLSEAQKAYEGARRTAQQLQRRSKQLAGDLEDTRVLMESQQSRNHELEKRQKKFDLQLAQALGESAFEKSLREKVAQENTGLQFQLGKLQQSLERKESENSSLSQRVEVLSAHLQELSASNSLDADGVAALRKKLWDLEARAAEQQEELGTQARTTEQLEQLHLRLELEIERMKQLHQKMLEDKEEELEDVRQSCQKRLRQLETQWERACEEKQVTLREKRDLEGLIAALCEQIGHRDFDVEKRLRRDLKRTHALLADVQLLLETSGPDSVPPGAKEDLEKLRGQLDESVARGAEAHKAQKVLALEVENLHTELEALSRNKILVDEQLYQLQHEKADLLQRIEEDQEDLNELMAKHKALIAQSAADIGQIRELQNQVEEMKKEKHSLQEKLQAAQARVTYLEQAMVERSIVSRQEALICDLENKMEFQSVQIKRFELLVLRLRDSVIKMGEDLEKAKEGEARERESARYYQMRMEEMKADLKELAERELEAHRRRVELEKQVDELSAVRQTLQADLETSIRRIADLQVALEEVQSSDESDNESVHTARESLSSRLETESQLSLGSTVSLHLEPEGSVASWLGSTSGWSSPSGPSVAGSVSRPSVDSSSSPGLRTSKDPGVGRLPVSPLGPKRKENGRKAGEADFGKAESPSFGARRREYGRPFCKEEGDSAPGVGAASPSMMRRLSSPTVAESKPPCPSSPSVARRASPAAEDKPPRSSSALSEYVEELRRKRLKEKEPGSLALDDASPLPIYQTAGASSLRRCRTLKDSEEFPARLEELGETVGAAGLVRSASLRSVSSDNMARPSLSPALKRAPRFGSYDSLVQNMDDAYSKLGSPAPDGDPLSPSRQKPWRSSLEASVEEGPEAGLGREPLVFQSKRFGEVGQESDPFAWKIPTLSYERKVGTEAEDFLPAIRKAQSTSSLSRGPRERPMSVRFEDEVSPGRSFLSEIKTLLSPSPRPKEDPGNLSDSSDSSSGSVVSCKSADSVKSRPKTLRPEGEGCVGKAGGEGAHGAPRSEAEGKEDDVNSIMMKYLGKE
ncbi:LOW QUALITY PROTEIN: unconventional myosin-XVIIIb [Pogona vitticeps]